MGYVEYNNLITPLSIRAFLQPLELVTHTQLFNAISPFREFSPVAFPPTHTGVTHALWGTPALSGNSRRALFISLARELTPQNRDVLRGPREQQCSLACTKCSHRIAFLRALRVAVQSLERVHAALHTLPSQAQAC